MPRTGRTFAGGFAKWTDVVKTYRQISIDNGDDHAIVLSSGDGEAAFAKVAETLDALVADEHSDMADSAAANTQLYDTRAI